MGVKSAKVCANWVTGRPGGDAEQGREGWDGWEGGKGRWGRCDPAFPRVGFGGIAGTGESGEISGKMAKEVLEKMWESGEDSGAIIAREGLGQISDSGELERLAREIVEKNAKQAADYRGGKDRLFRLFHRTDDGGDQRPRQSEDGQRNYAADFGLIEFNRPPQKKLCRSQAPGV